MSATVRGVWYGRDAEGEVARGVAGGRDRLGIEHHSGGRQRRGAAGEHRGQPVGVVGAGDPDRVEIAGARGHERLEVRQLAVVDDFDRIGERLEHGRDRLGRPVDRV